MPGKLKIITWNVNGIRAVERKGEIQKFIANHDPDVFMIQEIKGSTDQFSPFLTSHDDYHQHYSSAQKKGYAGTSLWVKKSLHELLVLELLAAVHLARHDAVDHEVEAAPHGADRVHAVIDAAGAEAVLRRLVTRAGAAELVGLGHPDVVVDDLAVARRLAPYGDAANDVHAGRLSRHDDLGHLLVGAAGIVGIRRPAHDDVEVGAVAVGGEPLVAVDDPLVAVEFEAGDDGAP